jgi:tRNA(Ile)-lysidine synthetase-like protein
MRKARYAALSKMAPASGCAWVLLAHQRDDQAETLLLNLTRGAGIAGLAGMAARRGIFLRPLLDVPRFALRRYLEESGTAAVEDPGNLDLARTRNRIRHRVLPLLESEVRPRSAERIARAAGNLRRALDALDALAVQTLATSCLPAERGVIRLDATAIRPYPEGLIERILHRAVLAVRGSTSDIHAETWRSMTRSLMRAGDARFLLPGGVRVDVRGKTVEIAPGDPAATRAGATKSGEGRITGTEDRAGSTRAGAASMGSAEGASSTGADGATEQDPIELEWTGSFAWTPRGRISTDVRPIPTNGPKLRIRGLTRVQVFDADLVRPPFRVRRARPGDFLELEDSAGSRKLSDLLSERMVPRTLRAEQPVLEDAGGILWAPGIRRAGRALVHMRTERIWIVRWSGALPADHAAHGGSSRK